MSALAFTFCDQWLDDSMPLRLRLLTRFSGIVSQNAFATATKQAAFQAVQGALPPALNLPLISPALTSPGSSRGLGVNLENESVAGEEDPGASLDAPMLSSAPPSGSASDSGSSEPFAPLKPGDEAPAGTPGTGENICRDCGGSGRLAGDGKCKTCDGTGKVTVGLGGG